MTEHRHEHLCLCRFSPDELEVLSLFINRIDTARAQYGALSIDSDERDFEWEEFLEDLDKPFYRCVATIKRRRGRNT